MKENGLEVLFGRVAGDIWSFTDHCSELGIKTMVFHDERAAGKVPSRGRVRLYFSKKVRNLWKEYMLAGSGWRASHKRMRFSWHSRNRLREHWSQDWVSLPSLAFCIGDGGESRPVHRGIVDLVLASINWQDSCLCRAIISKRDGRSAVRPLSSMKTGDSE